MIYLGIDPGKSGAYAIVCDSGVKVWKFPLAGDALDLGDIAAKFIDLCKSDDVRAYIEKVGAMPGQGVTSMFSFGFNTGAIHGILAAYRVPTFLVTPQAWKKVILAGTPKDKNSAVEYIRRAYPAVSLLPTEKSRKLDNNMAEALCIALYAKLMTRD
jgi:crossover junction endodeoxyribonuclease RuvC